MQGLASFFQEPKRFRYCECADAVVECARNSNVTAEQLEFICEGYGIADPHELLSFLTIVHADVDEQFMNLRRFLLSFLLHQMWRDVSDHTVYWTILRVDCHALRLRDCRIHTAELADV